MAEAKLLAGSLCLDFCNTAEWHAAPQPVERLTSYEALVAWSEQAGAVAEGEAKQLLAEAERQPREAEAVLQRAVSLREAIYRLFAALAHGRPVDEADLAELNAALAAALPGLRLVQVESPQREEGQFAWAWAAGRSDLDRMLWPVVRSAADLLTSADLARVRQCAGDPCGWLFIDSSRNHSRRWCSMEDCGNRAKARRHYRRQRETKVGAP